MLRYRKAADQGNAIAQYNLGLCSEHGNGRPKNKTAAIYWYTKAKEQGYENAAEKLKKLQ